MNAVLKYALIAGGVAVGVVLVRRVLAPPQTTPKQTPVGEILTGAANLISVIKGGSAPASKPDISGTLSKDSATTRAAMLNPTPIGVLGQSPFAVSTSPLVTDASLPALSQPTQFSSPAQRSIAGVNRLSPFAISTNIARA